MKSELNNLSKQALIELVLKQHIQAQNHREELQHHKSELQHKNFIIDQLSRMLFGTKSEKFKTVPVDPSQLTLSFEELTAIKQPVEEDQEPTEKPATKKPSNKKNHPGRHKLPDDLPEKVIVIEPEMSTEGLVKIGEEPPLYSGPQKIKPSALITFWHRSLINVLSSSSIFPVYNGK